MQRSPRKGKKYRVTLPDGTKVDFGGEGYSDYTKHGDALRMREYVRRHGGVIPGETLALTDPSAVHRAMLRVTKSTKENWADPRTPGFWSRWALWSHPDIQQGFKTARLKARRSRS
jgi:hypothetical protein